MRGYYLYRLFQPGPYWAVIRMNRKTMSISTEFRIRKLSDIDFIRSPDGEMKVRIGKRTFRATGMTPPNPLGT